MRNYWLKTLVVAVVLTAAFGAAAGELNALARAYDLPAVGGSYR